MTSTVTLNLNKQATLDVIGANPKLRFRKTDAGFEFRPTDRVSGVNLPKGEQLIEVVMNRGAVVGSKATITVNDATSDIANQSFTLSNEGKKYGWFTLTPVDTIPVGTAGLRAGSVVIVPDAVPEAATEEPETVLQTAEDPVALAETQSDDEETDVETTASEEMIETSSDDTTVAESNTEEVAS